MFSVNDASGGRKLPKALLVAFSSAVIFWFLRKWISNRMYFRKLRAQGLPMPPHSLVFGHLLIIANVLREIPNDAHQIYMPTLVRRAYPELGPNFYLDVWPFAPALLVMGTPETWNQIAANHSLKKTVMTRAFLLPLTKGLDMVSLEGAQWKKWRNIFNPGFSSTHLNSLVPWIVQEAQVYCQNLDKLAEDHTTFAMKPLTDNLTMDVIGKVALGVHFRCQTAYSQFVHSFRTEIEWLSTGYEPNLWTRYHPLRPFILWYHDRILNRYISQELDERFKARQDQTLKGNRTIMDLALRMHDELQTSGEIASLTLDPLSREIYMAQLKIFILAGHDTTSSAICFCLWTLSQHPKVLDQLREEHTRVFGGDPAQAAQQLSQNSQLLSQLPYTTAVIKESLRLFPPATTIRTGQAGFSIIDAQGRAFPTANVSVWPNQQSGHREQTYWTESEIFRPERWLVDPSDPLYTEKELWRPFGQGPRSCIAQELAMIEIKIVLIMVSRSYQIQPCYDEIDTRSGKKGRQVDVLGEKAYQIDLMQPRGNLPVRVRKI